MKSPNHTYSFGSFVHAYFTHNGFVCLANVSGWYAVRSAIPKSGVRRGRRNTVNGMELKATRARGS